MTNEFGDNYNLDEDATTNEWVISVNEIERLRVNAGIKSERIEIVCEITKNTIKMNFKQEAKEVYEQILLNYAKNTMSSYFSDTYPGQEITLALIYQDMEVNSIYEIPSRSGDQSVPDWLIRIGAATAEDFANIKDITGTITLKKGDTVIAQGNVSQSNWLESNLTESGSYTIIGETNDGDKATKTVQFEYDDTISFAIWCFDKKKDYTLNNSITFRQWITEYSPENITIREDLQEICIYEKYFLKNSSGEVVSPDEYILDGNNYYYEPLL